MDDPDRMLTDPPFPVALNEANPKPLPASMTTFPPPPPNALRPSPATSSMLPPRWSVSVWFPAMMETFSAEVTVN